MNLKYLVLLLFCASTLNAERAKPGCFRAAVFDQVRQVDQHSIPKTIELNLNLYERAAVKAKENDADILVVPEDGIIFSEVSRNETLQFGEVIPNYPTQMCQFQYARSHPIVHRLACIARSNRLYLEANVIDIQPCPSAGKMACTKFRDGLFAYNTAVLFDRSGTLLAKYHKMHLFPTESFKNTPPTMELVSVATSIGRLGLQTCFDLLYKSPGHELVRRGLVDTVLFSTSWYDQFPFLSANQFQWSWANAHSVNLLAANIHYPQFGKKGSGLYAGSSGEFEIVDFLDGESRVLVSNLPINSSSSGKCPSNAKQVKIEQEAPIFKHDARIDAYHLELNQKEVSMVPLWSTRQFQQNCAGGVCCFVDYKFDYSSLHLSDEFYLIVSNRTKPGPFLFTEEFCAVVHCPRRFEPCSMMRSNFPLQTKFHYLNLYGQFGLNTTVYASVIGSQHQLVKKGNSWNYRKINLLPNVFDFLAKIEIEQTEILHGKRRRNRKEKFTKPNMTDDSSKQLHALEVGTFNGLNSFALGTVALYGRPYHRDPPFVHQPLDISLN